MLVRRGSWFRLLIILFVKSLPKLTNTPSQGAAQIRDAAGPEHHNRYREENQ